MMEDEIGEKRTGFCMELRFNGKNSTSPLMSKTTTLPYDTPKSMVHLHFPSEPKIFTLYIQRLFTWSSH